MTHRVVLSARAEGQLREAYLWCASQSAPASRRWYNGILRAIAALRHNLFRCPLARESAKFPVEIREATYGRRRNFRILFTMHDEVVFVVSIRHAARDDLSDIDLP